MKESSQPIVILLAEDDPDDRLLCRDALNESGLPKDLRFVQDGEELLEYLCRQGEYTDPFQAPRPQLILLDLNMPRKDGREAHEEIKAIPSLRRIPIVVLTTSSLEEDIYKTYDLGVNGYVCKPVAYDELVEVMQCIESYWFKVSKLSPE